MPAFTFPGQGSQRPGMGRAWSDHPSWEIVAEASRVAGRDVARLLLAADQEELTLTANAQLATYVLGLVTLDAIERTGIEPTICAGHSLGEYTALATAGAVGFEDGIRLVVERGEAMHDAAQERQGTMAAVLGADDEAVEAACQRAEDEVWVANYNAPGQVAIAGTPQAVAAAGRLAKELGARKVMPFPVAGAFHTQLMAPARSRLRKILAETSFERPEIPVIANVDARTHDDRDDWPSLLSAQLCSPVRWRQSVDAIASAGATHIVEVGPGGVLSGLARRIAPELSAVTVSAPDDIDTLAKAIAGSDTYSAYASEHAGEKLYTSERLVVSPAAGIFEPHSPLGAPGPGAVLAGEDSPDWLDPHVRVSVGDVVGHVGIDEVRTPFAGLLVGYLALRGERVVIGQPIAWIRSQ